MKTPSSVGDAYDITHNMFLAAIKEPLDITAAFYNGNWRKSLEHAQRDKHSWVLEGIGFEPGDLVLDIGCGWGPMIEAINAAGGRGIGLTVSEKQATYCQEKGLEVYLHDWKETSPRNFGIFNGIVSIGAFEHFCSQEEREQSKQEKIYNSFFKFCYDSVKNHGRLFLQTMTWGNRVPNYPEDFKLNAKKGSDERILGTLFALSSWWPPVSKEQIIETARPYFNLVDSNNGREDYIRTFREWHRRLESSYPKKLLSNLGILWTYLTKRDLQRAIRAGVSMLRHHYFREAFISNILNHERMFFEKA